MRFVAMAYVAPRAVTSNVWLFHYDRISLTSSGQCAKSPVIGGKRDSAVLGRRFGVVTMTEMKNQNEYEKNADLFIILAVSGLSARYMTMSARSSLSKSDTEAKNTQNTQNTQNESLWLSAFPSNSSGI